MSIIHLFHLFDLLVLLVLECKVPTMNLPRSEYPSGLSPNIKSSGLCINLQIQSPESFQRFSVSYLKLFEEDTAKPRGYILDCSTRLVSVLSGKLYHPSTEPSGELRWPANTNLDTFSPFSGSTEIPNMLLNKTFDLCILGRAVFLLFPTKKLKPAKFYILGKVDELMAKLSFKLGCLPRSSSVSPTSKATDRCDMSQMPKCQIYRFNKFTTAEDATT